MRRIKANVERFQEFLIFSWRALVLLVVGGRPNRETGRQLEQIGVGSLLIVTLTGLFTGMVFTLQTGVGMARFGVVNTVGKIVVLGIVKELGPVISALVFAGRAGSAIAAHISSMVVTEQIEAIEAEGLDPMRRVVVPRLIACIVMLPVLTMIADGVALWGGSLICEWSLGVSSSLFWSDVYTTLEPAELLMGVIKPFFFGLVIGLCGAFYGMNTERDARGVGRATTRAVVVGTITVILLDFLITKFMIFCFGK